MMLAACGTFAPNATPTINDKIGWTGYVFDETAIGSSSAEAGRALPSWACLQSSTWPAWNGWLHPVAGAQLSTSGWWASRLSESRRWVSLMR